MRNAFGYAGIRFFFKIWEWYKVLPSFISWLGWYTIHKFYISLGLTLLFFSAFKLVSHYLQGWNWLKMVKNWLYRWIFTVSSLRTYLEHTMFSFLIPLFSLKGEEFPIFLLLQVRISCLFRRKNKKNPWYFLLLPPSL